MDKLYRIFSLFAGCKQICKTPEKGFVSCYKADLTAAPDAAAVLNRERICTMGKKIFPADVVAQAQDVLVGWTQIGSTVAFGTLTSALLTTDMNAYAPLDTEISKLEKQLAEKRNQREFLSLAIWDKVKRVRASVRGIYGDDSTQYELVGGTRMSDRKPRVRKVVTTE
jgi:hypothetical protein